MSELLVKAADCVIKSYCLRRDKRYSGVPDGRLSFLRLVDWSYAVGGTVERFEFRHA